ncbi:ROK family transcriptional regulator [Solihabitans fulvus]|uniref:ROK family transcriptional regulator n=1 Tax=Solihabitans fulvus TaxID=1892852 RepID=A0A5B2WZG2_9PSEU|nr:ROK family transcriptional regulator [Solihabitans fulvus]KAA2255976.1 ROK family transcriptional regulator [Solihabitans fulvus]
MPEPGRQTVRDLRRSNRSTLLRQLYFTGPCSRQELGGATGLSQASVSNVVGELIEDGVVVEAGSVDSDGGRPRILLRVDPTQAYVIGVDVGETWVRVELFDLALTELAKATHPLEPGRHDIGLVVAHILDGIGRVIADSGVDPATIAGVGIGVPGVVEQGAEVLVHSQTIGWDAVPVERLLRAGTDLPLFIDNGATTMGQAEMWFGAGRGSRNAVIALVGSGVGSCIITDGAPYRGTSSSAGEWGHTVVHVGGRPCRCGSRGCLEAYIGAEGVLERYRAAAGDGPAAAIDEESAIADLLADSLRDTARATRAREVLAETALYLGVGIANLVNLFNPERIIIGGWAGLLLGERLLPEIRDAASAHALRHPYAQTSIELCQLGPDSVALGAATLPIARFLATGGAPRDRQAAPRPTVGEVRPTRSA